MEKKELLTHFEQEFEKIRKDLKFKATLVDLDKIFFFRDYILKEGYVPYSLNRALAHRMMETMGSWNNYLHGLIVPNPGYLIAMNESEMFNKEEKQNIMKLMSKILTFTSKNSLNGLTREKDGQFFDDSLNFWNKTLQPELVKIMKRINEKWKEKA